MDYSEYSKMDSTYKQYVVFCVLCVLGLVLIGVGIFLFIESHNDCQYKLCEVIVNNTLCELKYNNVTCPCNSSEFKEMSPAK